jgi:hypothetical protein
MLIVPETTAEYDQSGTRRRHVSLIRNYLHVRSFDETGQALLASCVRLAAARMEDLADIINVAIEELVRGSFELPGFSTLHKEAKLGRTEVNRGFYQRVQDAIGANGRTAIDTLLSESGSQSRKTRWDSLKQDADVGTIHKVCANPTCPVHHPKQPTSRADEKWKAEQDKQRKEQAIANTTGLRVLAAVSAAVPVRLMKRDLLFILEKLVSVMDEHRVEMLARQHGIRQKRDDGGIGKTLTAFVRRADEGTLSRLLVEASILLAASRGNPTAILKEAATAYKVDTEAITAKVRQEFAAKEKIKKVPRPAAKTAKTEA